MSKAIIVLTRGYAKLSDYNVLLERNKQIAIHLKDKSIPLVFYHEGNITDEQQKYIQHANEDLKMQFIDISDKCFLKERENVTFFPRTDPAKGGHWSWGYGYRHMCNFWFKDFFQYIEEYDYVIRIDEDCYVKFSIDDAFDKIMNNKIPFLYGKTFGDPGFVVIDLNQSTMNFLKENGYDSVKSRQQVGPYTNIFGLNMIKIREKKDILEKYHDYMDKINGIYIYRWGDLPLWGEIMHYIFGIDCNKFIDKSLTYYHKSHGKNVN